jgi:hypothetical protein
MRGAAAIASLSILGLALVGGSIFWVVVNTVLFLTVRFNDQQGVPRRQVAKQTFPDSAT